MLHIAALGLSLYCRSTRTAQVVISPSGGAFWITIVHVVIARGHTRKAEHRERWRVLHDRFSRFSLVGRLSVRLHVSRHARASAHAWTHTREALENTHRLFRKTAFGLNNKTTTLAPPTLQPTRHMPRIGKQLITFDTKLCQVIVYREKKQSVELSHDLTWPRHMNSTRLMLLAGDDVEKFTNTGAVGIIRRGHGEWGMWHGAWGRGMGNGAWGMGQGEGGMGTRHGEWGRGTGYGEWGMGTGHGEWGRGTGYRDGAWGRGMGNGAGGRGMGTGHGEWGMGNGAWGMGHGEWGMGNGEWGMGNGAWGMGHGEWGRGTGHGDLSNFVQTFNFSYIYLLTLYMACPIMCE